MAAVGVTGAVALALLGALIRGERTPTGDDLIYQRMAEHPFAVHTFPFGYRIGLPLVVHLLPISAAAGFRFVAWLAAAGAGGFAYGLMVRLGTTRGLAAALAILMCISPPFLLVVIRQGRNTDIATVFILMAGAYYIVARAYWKLGVVLLLGVFVREAALFLVPLAYAVWACKPLDRRAAVLALSTGAPAVLAYAGLRLGLQTVGEADVPGYGSDFLAERLAVLKEGLRTPMRELRRIVSIYGPLWVVSPFALRRLSYARRGLTLVALSVVAMTFALDWGRMILLAAPVLYPAAAVAIRDRPKWRLPTLLLLTLLIAAYASYMQMSGVQHGIDGAGSPPYPVR